MLGLPFLPYPGLQQDEMLPVAPLYRVSAALYHPSILTHEIPVMLMSYLGAFKTFVLAPVVWLAGPSAWSIRIPPLLLGAISVGLVFTLLERIHSRTAAWIGMALLATDTSFLLTSCFDWGPVVLQHLLSLCGILLVVDYHQRHHRWALFGAAFCFGLGLWDKALLVWLLGGLVAATPLVFPQQAWRDFRATSWRDLAIASVAFAIGASPLLLYNVNSGMPTFHSTSGFSTADLYKKSFVLRSTWEGAGLFGYLVNEEDAASPRQPGNALERLSTSVRGVAGEHRRNAMEWGLLAALLCLPLLWGTATLQMGVFLIVTIAIGWLQMAITNGAGGAVHHVVLLWPLPHLLIAVVYAEMAHRYPIPVGWVFAIGTVYLVAMNLLVTNQYLYQFARDGAPGSWTDASYKLAASTEASQPSTVAVLDWGIIDPVDILTKGRLRIRWAAEPFQAHEPGTMPPAPDEDLLQDPRTLWVAHTPGNEQFEGVNGRFDEFLVRTHRQKISLQTIPDRNGRNMFQTFRLGRTE